ncbi:S8 family peptidase [Clostridium sp. 'White wine YQ']|uniref:S8 family peptidase n=1 Tax=Clostridium sp. 'White wine YQ' TaxID=3027474 RepID=UPI00236637E0|nr:S8 family peptidase [Clostridium sp. 'White wine YQ']MDD7794200.1 S8 family peptidase [Clostridium sp. 'White wine YQ']
MAQLFDSSFPWEKAAYTIIEYQGDIETPVKNMSNVRIFIVDDTRAILAVIGDLDDVINKLYDLIVYVNPNGLYTLCDISPIEASQVDLFHNNPFLQLDGKGVIVGIIDTGIDYLNEEFINDDNTTRIISIFDQTIFEGKYVEGQPIGSEFTRDDINRAIEEKIRGRDPYKVMPSKDEVGHGTAMAGIVGARGKNKELKGAAPGCSFAIVKLIPAEKKLVEEFGVYGKSQVYSTVALFLGLKYLYTLAGKLETPIVILLPLGGNAGPRNGQSFIERYVSEISRVKGVTVVVPMGNQGDGDTHTSGIIKKVGDTADVELKIDPNQKNMRFEIWISRPDKLTLSIISPTGEKVERVMPQSNKITELKFLYENTILNVGHYIPEQVTGEERIIINAHNIKEGIWIFRLTGEVIITGRYDVYLMQRELIAPDTKFLKSDPYLTLMTPAAARGAISVASYNQNNNTIVKESSRGYTRDGRIKPDIAAGGVNVLTTAVGGGTQIVSGTSVSSAVTAGCIALILEWGEVLGYDKALYSAKVRTYLIRGAAKTKGEAFPNAEWGYGMLNIKGVFDTLRSLDEDSEDGYYIGSLFIRLPKIN